MLILENAKKYFEAAQGTIFGGHNPESDFYHQFSKMIPDTIDVDTLVLAFKIALQDEPRLNKRDTAGFISVIPQYVRQFASPEFANEFRKKYNKEVLGLTQEELPDVDYGYNEVLENVIDISDKDRNEVLAALYNASTPIGIGFMDYNPMPWTKEFAQWYFKEYGKEDSDGHIIFKWIFGRPVSCTFFDNYVNVAAYNYENEEGLAQKAIATCPNKSNKLSKIKDKTR